MYFSAIQKIGEQALQSSTSQILGEGLPLPLDPCTHTPPAVPAPGHSPHLPSASPGPAPALLPFSGPRGGPFIALPLQEVPPQGHGPCSSGPRARMLPPGLLRGWDRCCQSPRAIWEIAGLRSQNPASDSSFWQLLAGRGWRGRAPSAEATCSLHLQVRSWCRCQTPSGT